MQLALTYALFAAVATMVNIGVQDLCVRFYQGGYPLATSIAAGTIAGLACKYLLDKRFIFAFKAKGVVDGGMTFLLYALMGVLTTALFWGVELAFELIWQSREMRYLGAVLGLAIGYASKYHLDKRFVFVKDPEYDT